jgi:hypothetical protein
MIANPDRLILWPNRLDAVLDNLSVSPNVLSAGNQQCRIRMLVACIQQIYPLYTQLAG